jgi:cytochrome P450
MVCEEPGLVRDAVEETLRYDAPLQYLPRVAKSDMTIGGVDIAAGETLLVFIGAANRDPDVFHEPDRYDITRSGKAQHLALAFGAHFCLGSHLARMEGQVALGTLAARFPEARLATDTFHLRRQRHAAQCAVAADRARPTASRLIRPSIRAGRRRR